jgi:SnoaL-like domain
VSHDALSSQALRQAADVSSITQLVLLERECRDLGRWERMRSCFHPDSRVRLSWYTGDAAGFVEGSIEMARRGMLAKHRLGPVLVRLGADRAVASLNGIIDIPATLHGIEAQLSSHARFLYCVERREGTWKIHSFDAVYLRDELVPVIPGQVLEIAPAKLAGFRRPYRMLSYLLNLQGYGVNMELAADDRPESWRALEQELFGWAGVEA